MSQRAALGDTAAFASLVEKYERPLRSFLARMGAGELADDIAQEAFVKAWKGAGQYDGRARYSTWLFRIGWRCRIDELRRARQADLPQAAATGIAASELDDMLGRLSESERAALVLCDGHGWTHAEAAQLLAVPLGTLKSTVARAKAKCRAMWEGAEHG